MEPLENCTLKTSIMPNILKRRDTNKVMEGYSRHLNCDEGRRRQIVSSTSCMGLPSRHAKLLLLVAEQSASYLARMLNKEGSTGTRGNGQRVWQELASKYLEVTDYIIWRKSAALGGHKNEAIPRSRRLLLRRCGPRSAGRYFMETSRNVSCWLSEASISF